MNREENIANRVAKDSLEMESSGSIDSLLSECESVANKLHDESDWSYIRLVSATRKVRDWRFITKEDKQKLECAYRLMDEIKQMQETFKKQMSIFS